MTVALPILLPLGAAGLAALLRNRPRAEATVVMATTSAVLVLTAWNLAAVVRGGPMDAAAGGWAPPIGIALHLDGLSALLAAVAALVSWTCVLQGLGDIGGERRRTGHMAFVLVIVGGVQGALATADLFNLYVWFEVMLAASFGLMALGRSRTEIEGALRYMLPNFVGSMLFLLGIAILYGVAGTLSFAQLAEVAPLLPPKSVLAASAFLATAFLLKAAMFPLHAWLPATYSVTPASVSALYAALLGKVGVYALLRVLPLLGAPWGTALIWIGATSMVLAVLAAYGQTTVRRILSFHIISQMGYAVSAIGLGTPLAYTAAVLFVVHNMLAKTALFQVAGILRGRFGTDRLDGVGGAWSPAVCALFLVPALALVGFPPSTGFWAKWSIVRATIASEAWLLLGAALLTGVMTLLSMMKIWSEAFWKPAPTPLPQHVPLLAWVPALLLGATVVAAGLAPEPMLRIAHAAGATLAGAP